MKDTSFKISYSRINAYLFCPNKYKIVYVDCKYIPLNGDMAFGNSIHKTLDHFYKNGVYTYDALMDSLNVSWESGGFDNAQEVYAYYLRALEVLKNFWETFAKYIPKKISTEHNFKAEIGQYPFVGIIDRIDEYEDGTKELVDYKTHKNIWPQERVDNDLQLSLYCYACKIALGFIPDRIAIYFLSHNKKIYTTRNEEQIQQAIELCINVADKISNSDFTPNTKNCHLCDFKATCHYSVQKTKEPEEFKVTISDRLSNNQTIK